jgi:hypothetical protein
MPSTLDSYRLIFLTIKIKVFYEKNINIRNEQVKFKVIISLIIITFLFGCVNAPMPEELYSNIAKKKLMSGVCYKKKMIPATLYSDYNIALDYSAHTWTFSQDKFKQEYENARKELTSISKAKQQRGLDIEEELSTFCHEFKPQMIELINRMRHFAASHHETLPVSGEKTNDSNNDFNQSLNELNKTMTSIMENNKRHTVDVYVH